MTQLAHNAHPKRRTNEGAENYAKAIYELQGRGDRTVGTSAVADRVGVTRASASGMLRRLAEEGLVDYAPYRGVRLTSDGERIALEMIRHHRLIELFLAEVLGMPWDRVHAEAEVLEHHISEELEELIAEKLGQPALDPHRERGDRLRAEPWRASGSRASGAERGARSRRSDRRRRPSSPAPPWR